MNRTVDAILACRVQGSRLYGKPLQRLVPGGVTVLECLIEYLRAVPSVRHIVLAISEEKENWGFVELAEQHGLPYVVGHQQDVLARMIKAAALKGTQHILRTTSECPFMLHEFAEPLIAQYFEGDYDWAGYENTPEGTGFELIKTAALHMAHTQGSDRHRSELVTSYIFDHQEQFRLLKLQLPSKFQRPEVRLTVDYAEDLTFCQQVYAALKQHDQLIPVEDIIAFWDRNPALREPLEKIGVDWGHGRLWK